MTTPQQRIDPKCWCCGVFTEPLEELVYQPLRCVDCKAKLKDQPKFKFTRKETWE